MDVTDKSNLIRETGNKDSDRVTTVETAFEIIDTVQRSDGATVTEVAADLDLAKSTVHRHVTTLESLAYLTRSGNEYEVGLKFLEHGIYARDRTLGYDLARVKAEELAEETGEVSLFMTEENGRGVVLERQEGEHAVKTASKVGRPSPLHATSLGKAILSALPDERIREIIARDGLAKETEQTITDEQRLFEEIREVRERGYAINNEEYTHGVRGVAAPITDGDGRLVGSLSVGAPSYRMTDERLEDEIIDMLLGAVNEIGVNITYA